MNCDSLSILQITDGTTVVDLLDERSGFLLKEWVPQTAEFKDGGIFQDSPLAQGRRLVAYRYANVVETMAVSSRHESADALIRDTQTLRRLLQKAADYWATDWQNTPVYVVARGKGESNTRYCIIQQGRLGTDGNPYAQPFMQPSGSGRAVFDDQPLIFERGDWLSEEPGSTISVPMSGTQKWTTPADWDVLTTTPTGDITTMLETADGTLFAGTDDTAKLYRSLDGGVTWSLNYTFGSDPGDVLSCIIEAEFAGDTYLMITTRGPGGSARGRSTSNGDSWDVATPSMTFEFWGLSQGTYTDWVYIYGHSSFSGGSGLLGAFTTSVSSFSSYSDPGIGEIRGLVVVSEDEGNLVYIADDHVCLTSYLYFVPGTTRVTHGSGTFQCIYKLASGRILAGMDNGVIYYADADEYESGTWSTATTTLTGGVYSLTQDDNGVVWAGGSSRIWVSYNNGDVWYEYDTTPSTTVKSMLPKSNGEIYAGDAGQILVLDTNEYSATIEHVIGGHPIADITNIKIYDASATSYTDLFPGGSLPYQIPLGATQDILYIGINDDAGAFSFANVVFNITVATRSGGGNGTWSYWNGSSWSSLNPAVNIRGLAGPFSEVGQYSVAWSPPSNWATTTVDGVTARWIRVTLTYVSSSPYPSQGESDVYASRNAYVEVAANAVRGDLPALAQIEIEVASDQDGPGGSAPNGYINRAIVGLRSVSRGERFQAYLNASDQGNDPSVQVSLGADTTFNDDITYPTNRRVTFSPSSTGSWADVITWTLAGDLVGDYHGTFHAFLRARQSGGSAGQVALRVVISTGSGGIEFTTISRTFENTSDNQFIDLGRITLPVSSIQNTGESGDEAIITVQCNASSTTPDVYFKDLVLIPVDEWLGDFTDQANGANSPVTGGYYLDVDSATFPKRSVRAMVRNNGSNYIKNVFQPATNGEAILQANAAQRLWFFFARTDSAGSSTWYSESFVSAKITLKANQRYLSMRGDR